MHGWCRSGSHIFHANGEYVCLSRTLVQSYFLSFSRRPITALTTARASTYTQRPVRPCILLLYYKSERYCSVLMLCIKAVGNVLMIFPQGGTLPPRPKPVITLWTACISSQKIIHRFNSCNLRNFETERDRKERIKSLDPQEICQFDLCFVVLSRFVLKFRRCNIIRAVNTFVDCKYLFDPCDLFWYIFISPLKV